MHYYAVQLLQALCCLLGVQAVLVVSDRSVRFDWFVTPDLDVHTWGCYAQGQASHWAREATALMLRRPLWQTACGATGATPRTRRT